MKKIRKNEMGWASGMYGRKERRIQSFGGDEEKGRLGRPWRRWEDIIKMDLQEVGLGR
jgi:hypothetical protein